MPAGHLFLPEVKGFVSQVFGYSEAALAVFYWEKLWICGGFSGYLWINFILARVVKHLFLRRGIISWQR